MNLVKQRGTEILKRLPKRAVLGAEVGVWDGRLSQFLLSSRNDLSLFMVDRWRDVPDGHRYKRSNSQMANTSPEGFAEVQARAWKVVNRYPSRAKPLKGESVEMANHVADGALDFVFIDADHSYEGVKEDIAAWFPKLKPGGLMGGHDWDHPDHQDEWGVRKAVEEFAETVKALIQTGKNRTWFLAW